MDASIGDTVESIFVYDDCNRPPPTQDTQQAQEDQRFACTPQSFVDVHLTATIVGIVERTDVDDPYWTTGSISFNRPRATEDNLATVPVVMPEATFFQALPRLLPSFPHEFRLLGLIDPSRLTSANLDDAQESLQRLRERIEVTGAITDLSTERPLARSSTR